MHQPVVVVEELPHVIELVVVVVNIGGKHGASIGVSIGVNTVHTLCKHRCTQQWCKHGVHIGVNIGENMM